MDNEQRISDLERTVAALTVFVNAFSGKSEAELVAEFNAIGGNDACNEATERVLARVKGTKSDV